jgi:hypothetical protein
VIPHPRENPATEAAEFCSRSVFYAAFFSTAFNFAHLARCAAAILLRAEADIV